MRQPTGVSDILALYYLSMSLQESPSTANNVGILLASVQQTASQQQAAPEPTVATTIPGIAPGTGLALALAYLQLRSFVGSEARAPSHQPWEPSQGYWAARLGHLHVRKGGRV